MEIKNKNKIIIAIVITISICIISIVICFSFSCIEFIRINNEFINKIENKVEEREEINDIIDELISNEIIPDNWTVVSELNGTMNGFVDYSTKYYFLIDNKHYEEYKHYWLEDISKLEYTNNYNYNLSETGDYIFHTVNIRKLVYNEDTKHNNVNMLKDTVYYSVRIYNNSIFYKYIYNYKNINDYSIGSDFNINYNSLLEEYIFYKKITNG